jgi:AmmeMemoRadiSam system protein B
MSVHPAAVADLFYPGNADDLTSHIAAALRDATAQLPESLPVPKAIIVPHAGYIYSGSTAGFAYAALKQANIKRVVLLGPAHRIPFYGMALSGYDAFATPLGEVRLDAAAIQKALTFADVQINDAAHAQEHALEVQLPFLQTVLNDFLLLPLCIGSVQPDAVASVIESLWGDDKTLFVISSDLSHFHPYAEAKKLDLHSIETILQLRGDLSHEQACGATGINALLRVAQRKQLNARMLDYRNSGDTAGDKDRVVGYASIAFFEPERI